MELACESMNLQPILGNTAVRCMCPKPAGACRIEKEEKKTQREHHPPGPYERRTVDIRSEKAQASRGRFQRAGPPKLRREVSSGFTFVEVGPESRPSAVARPSTFHFIDSNDSAAAGCGRRTGPSTSDRACHSRLPPKDLELNVDLHWSTYTSVVTYARNDNDAIQFWNADWSVFAMRYINSLLPITIMNHPK